MNAAASARFRIGRIVVTPGVLSKVANEEILAALGRHHAGDWGDLDDTDKRANERAPKEGTRLLSAYRAQNGTKFRIITEADRSVTTIFLPHEY